MSDKFGEKARELHSYGHSVSCKAGKHCEDPWCHYLGPCTCGLDDRITNTKAALREVAADAVRDMQADLVEAKRLAQVRLEHSAEDFRRCAELEVKCDLLTLDVKRLQEKIDKARKALA